MAKQPTESSTAPEHVDLVVAAPVRPLDLVVEAWFLETFYGVHDLKVEHFNRFRQAADRLKDRLAAAKE